MNLCFFPIENKTNSYINNMINIFKESEISIYSLDEVKKSFKLFKKIDIFHFNWYENLDAETHYKAVYNVVKKILLISFIKLFNKKIIWTMHNKIPHDSINNKLALFMLKFMAKKSDKIVIHSKHSKEVLKNIFNNKKLLKKVVYVHHVDYINNYKIDNKLSRKTFGIDDNQLVLVFCGAVRKYKNIEILIKVFNELKLKNCKLIIAGNPHTSSYKQELNKIIKGNENIVTNFKFLSDDELFSLINLSDALILPYNKKSSLNSGSIILGFSSKRTVISSMIGTLLDMKGEDFYYGYDYDDEKEHCNKLKDCIIRAYNDYINDKNILKKKGIDAFSYINKYYNSNVVKKELNDLYNDACENKRINSRR